MKTCSKCGCQKDESCFPKRVKGEARSRCWCSVCNAQQSRRWRADATVGTWLLRKAKTKKKQLGKVTITADELDSIFIKQQGKCAYSGVKLEDVRVNRHPLAPTVDRIDSSKGYLPGNVVICAYCVNNMKNDAPAEEFERILRVIADSVFANMWSKAA